MCRRKGDHLMKHVAINGIQSVRDHRVWMVRMMIDDHVTADLRFKTWLMPLTSQAGGWLICLKQK